MDDKKRSPLCVWCKHKKSKLINALGVPYPCSGCSEGSNFMVKGKPGRNRTVHGSLCKKCQHFYEKSPTPVSCTICAMGSEYVWYRLPLGQWKRSKHFGSRNRG